MPEVTAEQLARWEAKLDLLLTEQIKLRTLVDTEAERCPHREAIARSANNRLAINANTVAVGKLDDVIMNLRIRVAGMAALVGLIAGVGGQLISALILSKLGM